VNAFDAVAASFERDRALPDGVAVAVRRAVAERAPADPAAPLVEVGCGTGRIGAAFCAAGDHYVGIDLSGEMLRAFRARPLARPPQLLCADAGALPFRDGACAAVLMMHVLTAENWRFLLAEARRVLCKRGILVLGKAEAPADGIDALMRRRLNELVAELGAPVAGPKRDAIGAWLAANAGRREDVVATTWTAMRAPRDFLLRKRSAARFGQLPATLREAALASLATWAESTIGLLDAPRPERHAFNLQFHWFDERRCRE
jgi:ubiquinone/menaquinone biosynthesis C-methylase UbiE